jgi:effector-binding domain-containing protein
VDPDGKYYNWESSILGSGEMSIENEQENQSINCDLQFFEPWRSKAKVTFYLNAKNSGTEVVWTMRSSLPFYLSWMKKQMHVFIGMDYERGLNLLKDLAENGKNMCKLNFEGIITYEATHYYGFKRKSSYCNFKIEMAHHFKELAPYMTEHYKELVNGPPFSIFHKFNLVKGRVNYTIGFPIKYPIASSNQRYFVGSLPKMRVHSIEHLGPYRHLSNAWAAQMMYQRSKQFRPLKKIAPFEIYLNNPSDTPEKALKTKVMFPVR